MKPAAFEYHAATSLPEALEVLRTHGDGAKLLAGGQSLIPVMSFRLAQPAFLVDLNPVRELDFVRRNGDGSLGIGALTRQRRIEREPLVAEAAPLLAGAMPFVAHPQIRSRGTVGGSLAHADPAAELPAVMVVLGARFRLQSAAGDRWVGATEFFLGLFATALTAEEILTEIEVPPLPPGSGWGFHEVARRHGDYAQVGAAAVVSCHPDGRCREARLAFLSVGDTPVSARGAAALLVGTSLTDAAIAEAAEHAAQNEIEPSGDIHASAEFKRHLARVVAVRALREARGRAEGVQ